MPGRAATGTAASAAGRAATPSTTKTGRKPVLPPTPDAGEGSSNNNRSADDSSSFSSVSVQDKRVKDKLMALAMEVSTDYRPAELFTSFTADKSVAMARRINKEAAEKRREFAGKNLIFCRPVRPEERDLVDYKVPKVDERLLYHHFLSKEEQYEEAYAQYPRLHRRCDYCGGKRCSRFIRGTTLPSCNNYKSHTEEAPDRRMCDYRRCDTPHTHQTPVCPIMHMRCQECGCRGHAVGCDRSNSAIMSALRADFEEFAPVGLMTRDRKKDPAWGWYPYPRTAKRRPDRPAFVYRDLKDMEVLEALDYVAGVHVL